MIVKLRKGQKYSKISNTIANFNETLLKFGITISSEQLYCLNRLSRIPISSLKSQRPINLEHNNYPKI